MLALLAALLLAPPVAAQTVDDWRTDPGFWPAFVATDSTGHVYAISGGFDVTRIDPDGNPLWRRRHDVGGPNNHEHSCQCVVDSTDAVIVTGYSEDTGEFMTVKWDTQGVLQWAHIFKDGDADEAFKIRIDEADNVYVTGHSYDLSTFSLDFLTVSIDPAGNTRWSRRFDVGGSEQPTALALRPDRRSAVAGHVGNSTVVVVSYDSLGNELWSDTFYPVLIAANSATMASDGAVYISGVSVNGGHIMCYGPTGTLEWEFEHDRPGFPIWSNYRKVTVDSQDRAVACGQADGLGGYTDWPAVCVDRQGNLVWEDYVNGFESNDEWAEALTVGPDDAGPAGGKICNDAFTSWMHGLVVKWDRNGVRQWEHHYNGTYGGTITPGVLALDPVDRVLAGTTAVTRVSDSQRLQLWVTGLAAGGTARLIADNGAFLNTMYFLASTAGVANGPCPGGLGGLCLDVLAPVLVGSAPADSSGKAILAVPVPPRAQGLTLYLQAVTPRGTGGAGSISSNVVVDVVQ